MLTLLRCATGEFWNGLMYDLAISHESCIQELEFDPNMCGFSNQPTCATLNGCGSVLAYPYFVLFTLIITFVTIELFTAVIMDGFEDSSEQEKINKAGMMGMTDGQYHEYCRVWLKHDPHLKWTIDLDTLTKLVEELPAPMGISEAEEENGTDKKQPANVEVNDAISHYTYTVDTPLSKCGISFGASEDTSSVVVLKSSVFGVEKGDVLVAVKARSAALPHDVTSQPVEKTLHSLTTMKVPIEITLLRREKTWLETLVSYGLREVKRGSGEYEFNTIAKALSKKVLLENAGDDPRRVIQELEKTNKKQMQAEETKQEVKWNERKARISKLVSSSVHPVAK